MPRRRASSSSTNVPIAWVRTRVGLGDRAVDVRLGGEVDDGVGALDRTRDGRGVLDGSVHEAVVDALEVLAASRVGELVEHDDLVALLARAQAREVRAGAAADEQLHVVTSVAPRAARGRRRVRPARRQPRRLARSLGAQHAEGGARRGAGNSAVVAGWTAHSRPA